MMTIFGRTLMIIMILWICTIPSIGNEIVQGCWTLQSSRPSSYSQNDGFGIMDIRGTVLLIYEFRIQKDGFCIFSPNMIV